MLYFFIYFYYFSPYFSSYPCLKQTPSLFIFISNHVYFVYRPAQSKQLNIENLLSGNIKHGYPLKSTFEIINITYVQNILNLHFKVLNKYTSILSFIYWFDLDSLLPLFFSFTFTFTFTYTGTCTHTHSHKKNTIIYSRKGHSEH